MASNPVGQTRFRQFACSHGEYCQGRVSLGRVKAAPIDAEKQTQRQKCGSFVSINERMILCQAYAVTRSQGGKVWRFVQGKIQRARECGFQQTFVAQSAGSAMFSQTLFMQKQQNLPTDPLPIAHLAS